MTTPEKHIEKASDDAAPAVKFTHTAPTSVQQAEPEDAYLTGGQRNLQRRVLGLNVEAGHAERLPDQVPGLHATGSLTGVANGEKGKKK